MNQAAPIIVPMPDKPENSFISSGTHELKLPDRDPIELQPWTPDRIIAGQAMGMVYPGEVDFDRFKETKRYAGDLKDTIIALWLMTILDEEVDASGNRPSESFKKAKEWAHTLGIDNMKSDAFYEALLIYLKIVHFEVTESGGNEFVESEGDSGND